MRPLINKYYPLVIYRSRKNGFASVLSLQARFLSTAPGCVDETISLPVGNNGLISLKVTHPPRANLLLDNQVGSNNLNVILFLPSGPLFQGILSGVSEKKVCSDAQARELLIWKQQTEEYMAQTPQHALATATSATVVTVNYRLGTHQGVSVSEGSAIPDTSDAKPELEQCDSAGYSRERIYRYPTPVHDTLAGFDWIQANLRPARIGVFGSHIGGSLALMLALTEPQSVHAVAALEPICDWPGLDEYCISKGLGKDRGIDNANDRGLLPSKIKRRRISKKKISPMRAPPDLVPLLEARERFFASPERYFDSFASPILFLRSAGRDVPQAFPKYLTGPDDPVPVLKDARIDGSLEHQCAPDSSVWEQDMYPAAESEGKESSNSVRRRKAISRWPPYGLDYGLSGGSRSRPGQEIGRLQITLPWTQVFVSDYIGRLSRGVEPSSESSVVSKESESISTVLAKQGEEMVSMMRRACFWGREKGFGERRATLCRVTQYPDEEICCWIGRIFDGSLQDE
ncbi:hypothetical protein N7462_010670 [Penicillium macrosclerotiorum]|uniref:uncharacterized protein n=1 Tax=Penicillium macrosclerotiorum TaxID=303699 RepID=UPI0025480290|nr:uncharacterized protein N7462_010670 [Penicillium macrosclerotiorum]KAJ5669600.1 hypothetical protein N7462_010670 [Penicillium macrosclerotiorum]